MNDNNPETNASFEDFALEMLEDESSIAMVILSLAPDGHTVHMYRVGVDEETQDWAVSLGDNLMLLTRDVESEGIH